MTETVEVEAPAAPAPTPPARLLVAVVIAALVSLSIGLFARFHDAHGIAINVAGFHTAIAAKAWLTTLAAFLAICQLLSALNMYGKLGSRSPSWIGRFHRWSGRAAFITTIPVALHCLFAFGLQTFDARVLIHSLLGCVFYGVFTLKMLVLTKRGVAGWLLPLLGGLAFAVLIGLWSTAGLWFFTNVGFKF
jgi:hypothetical protein